MRQLHLVTTIVGVAVPLVVLAGWATGIEWMRSVWPGLTAMNPLTAIGFVLVAAALVARVRGREVACRTLGSVTVVVGGWPILAEAAGTGFRPDALLFRTALDTYDPVNRMAPNTSVCFVAAGVALWAMTVKGTRPASLSQLLGVFAAVLGALTVVGYIMNEIGAAQVLGFIPMALNTGMLFLLVGASIMFARPSEGVMSVFVGDRDSSRLARLLLFWSAGVVILINVLRLWGENAGFYGRPVSMLLFSTVVVAGLTIVIGYATKAYSRADAARRDAQESERRQARFVRDVVDTIPSHVFARDGRGRYVFVNEHVAQALGASPENVIGKTTFDFVPDSPNVRQFTERDDRVLATGQPETFMAEVVGEGGETSTLQVHLRRLDSPLASEQLVFGIATDITELIKAREDAKRANEAKSEFISRMSHELRTPLNAVMGFTQLIQLHSTDKKTQDSVEQILKAGRHLLQLINEVLDLARVEAGRLAVSLEPVVVEEAVQMALGIVRPIADERGVTIDDKQSQCGTVSMYADRQRLAQILINLLTNAVKYNRRNGRVSLRCGETNGRVFIEISDTGTGIPEEYRHKLFEPFERLAERETEGTGLGLSLSRRLAHLMSGSLVLASSSSDGSTFRLELPRADGALIEEAKKAAEAAPAADLGVGAEGVRVLYIEDNLANLRLIEQVLAEWGPVSVLSAMQGSIGLEIARSQRPHLVLLDLHLPDLSGFDVLREIRLDERTATIPVIILSAEAGAGPIRKAKSLGADEYLTKPIDVVRLLQLLTQMQRAGWKRAQ